jgi:hypothetical protein
MGLVLAIWALPWLWLGALFLLCIADVILTESECFGWGTFILLAGIVTIAWVGGDVNVFKWTWFNLTDVLKFTAVYVLIGVLWSVVKWYFYLVKIRKELKANLASGVRRVGDTRPRRSFAKNNKARITGWMAHWPFSIVGTIVGDFLLELWNTIYEWLSGVYERIETRVFKDL